jgi:predicted RND superfamily exporter protein
MPLVLADGPDAEQHSRDSNRISESGSLPNSPRVGDNDSESEHYSSDKGSQGSRLLSESKEQEEVPPRKAPPCACCSRCDKRKVTANYQELDTLKHAMKHLQLTRDLVIHGELIPKGAQLVRVGKWKRRGHWVYSTEVENACMEALLDFIDNEENARVYFSASRPHCPWFVLLKCPCCAFCFNVILVLGIIAAGFRGGVPTIETNTDSFMDSDGEASLLYNAYLAAIKKQKPDERRLRAEDDQLSFRHSLRHAWEDLRVARRLPVLDETGKWHPNRYLARLVVREEDSLEEPGDSQFTWRRSATGAQNGTYNRALASTGGRRLNELYKMFSLSLIYASKSNGNVLTRSAFDKINRVERTLKEFPEFRQLCDTADPFKIKQCKPGLSFDNIVHAFPQSGGAVGQSQLVFNGSGKQSLPLELALSYASGMDILILFFPKETVMSGDQKINHDRYVSETLPCFDRGSNCAEYKAKGDCNPFSEYEMYMRDFCASTCNFCGTSEAFAKFDATSAESPVVVSSVRTYFKIAALCCFSNKPQADDRARMDQAWDDLVKKLVDMMRLEQDDDNPDGVRIFYSGDKIETYEAMSAVQNDLMWAIGSYCFVIVYATLHTRSILLANVGLFLVMLGIPSALSIFILASGSDTVSLMMCLSLFIVIGIGSDMLFVYTDFWKQSLSHSRDPTKRLIFTYKQAATSTAATTFTTAMSFFANLASVLRPLREFGFFMGVCVTMVWLIMCVAYPPILVIGERCHRRIQRCLEGGGHDAEPVMEQSSSLNFGRKTRKSLAVGAAKGRKSMAAFLDPEKKGIGEVHKDFAGTKVANAIGNMKFCLVPFFLGFTALCMFLAARDVKQADGPPQIFPPDHNQVMGKEYERKYVTFEDSIANRMGELTTECNDLFATCSLYSCPSRGAVLGSASQCRCEAAGAKCLESANSKITIDMRIIGRQGMVPAALAGATYSSPFQAYAGSKTSSVEIPAGSKTSDVLFQSWGTGEKMLGSLLAATATFDTTSTSPDTCNMKAACFCGVQRCVSLGTGTSYGIVQLPNITLRRLQHEQRHPMSDAMLGRRLQIDVKETGVIHKDAVNVRPDEEVDVNIVIGIKVTGTQPKLGVDKNTPFEFQSDFNVKDPWAQRKMVDLCEKLPKDEKLKVWKTKCWMTIFRDAMIAQGKDWPLRATEDVNELMHSWATATKILGNRNADVFFWFNSDKQVQATYFVHVLSVSKNLDAGEAIELMKLWDEYFKTFNDGQAGANYQPQDVWHCSKLWVRASAEKVIIDSTLVTLAISLGCVFLGIFLFTCSMHLAFLVMLVVGAIIVCLLFFMTSLMQWKLGAIEVLCLIVFVGFAVDYCLHVAHKYHSCHIQQVRPLSDEEIEAQEAKEKQERGSLLRGSVRISGGKPRMSMEITFDDTKNRQSEVLKKVSKRSDERYFRTKYALQRMGGAVIGSACTTIGCAAFLLPCELAIFTRIGAVVMAVTISSVIYTVLPLPALLMICGPCGRDLSDCKDWALGRLRRARGGIPLPWEAKKPDRSSDEQPRRYIHNMPTRRMSAPFHPDADVHPTRLRVTATG